MDLYSIIQLPLFTEKTEQLKEEKKKRGGSNRYVFRVLPNVCKESIRQALYHIYHVNAVKINTIIVPGKKKQFRTGRVKLPAWKKAIVTLAAGEELDFSAKQKK